MSGEIAPKRPYGWPQWTGVGLFLFGVAAFLAYVAGRFGWVRELVDTPLMGTTFMLLGAVLTNSRRSPLAPATKRHRLLIVLAAAALCLLAAVLIFYLKGA